MTSDTEDEEQNGTRNERGSHSHRPITPDSSRPLSDIPLSPRTLPSLSYQFRGGPDIRVSDHDEKKSRRVSDSDYRPRRLSHSDTGESVTSVDDLGLSAVSTPAPQPPIKPGKVMNSDEIRTYFDLKSRSENSEATVEGAICDAIEARLEVSKMGDEDYLPINAFEGIFKIDVITSLLHEKSSNSRDNASIPCLEDIFGKDEKGGRRRILAILVCMKQFNFIHEFIKAGIYDHDFPLTQTERKAFKTHTKPESINKTLLASWSRNDIMLLYQFQKQIFVPFFNIKEGTICSYFLTHNTVLPWRARQYKTSGGNAMVHQVQIHPSHHNFLQSQTSNKMPFFALKEIESGGREVYRKELRALEKCCAKIQTDKHLIKLLLTFQHGEKYYLLFEWADGNLKEFWETRTVEPSPSAATWAAQQCFGIASAIKRIHGFATWQIKKREAEGLRPNDDPEYGRHGDIKPQNILWFATQGNDRNLLVVSDLGLTRYHSKLTKSQDYGVDGLTRGYRPPEIDLRQRISPSYDIWSLGCVFLEFVLWYLVDFNAVEQFELDRVNDDISQVRGFSEDKYFNIITKTGQSPDGNAQHAVVKPVVQECIKRLRSLDKCTTFPRLLLNLIETRMLVVDRKERARIDIVCTELASIKATLETSQTGEEDTEQPVFQPMQEFDNETPPSPAEKDILVSHTGGDREANLDRPLAIPSAPGDGTDGPLGNLTELEESSSVEGRSLVNGDDIRSKSPVHLVGSISAQSCGEPDIAKSLQIPTPAKALSDSTRDTTRSDQRSITTEARSLHTSPTGSYEVNTEPRTTCEDNVRHKSPKDTSDSEQPHQDSSPGESNHVPEPAGTKSSTLRRIIAWVKKNWKAMAHGLRLKLKRFVSRSGASVGETREENNPVLVA
ncbi:hypothetical protein B0T10DRAFT_596840 [Thelonectria olida]|uniref:Protein kinase domain-containing protein n=1 Tax=Thelonectria olida TaxID=1576542 RepID=A0A9P8W4W0_9HYPO|nr:hypothetical protein B0T10DRAFT_596840 [Thelonectria olida]